MLNVSHILFATDWPFSAPVCVVPGDPAPQLSHTSSTGERARIERVNALTQPPTVAPRLAAG